MTGGLLGRHSPQKPAQTTTHDKRMKVFSTEGAKKGFLKSEDLL